MQNTSDPEFHSVTPILAVDDPTAALAYYERVLGFAHAWSWGDPVRLIAVCRGDVELNLSGRTPSPPSAGAAIYIRMANVDAYYARVIAAGARILVPLAAREYGLCDFRLADPYGNELSFGEVFADAPST